MSRISLVWEKKLSDFLHQADIKSLNSAKSMDNLIPDGGDTIKKGLQCVAIQNNQPLQFLHDSMN